MLQFINGHWLTSLVTSRRRYTNSSIYVTCSIVQSQYTEDLTLLLKLGPHVFAPETGYVVSVSNKGNGIYIAHIL